MKNKDWTMIMPDPRQDTPQGETKKHLLIAEKLIWAGDYDRAITILKNIRAGISARQREGDASFDDLRKPATSLLYNALIETEQWQMAQQIYDQERDSLPENTLAPEVIQRAREKRRQEREAKKGFRKFIREEKEKKECSGPLWDIRQLLKTGLKKDYIKAVELLEKNPDRFSQEELIVLSNTFEGREIHDLAIRVAALIPDHLRERLIRDKKLDVYQALDGLEDIIKSAPGNDSAVFSNLAPEVKVSAYWDGSEHMRATSIRIAQLLHKKGAFLQAVRVLITIGETAEAARIGQEAIEILERRISTSSPREAGYLRVRKNRIRETLQKNGLL